MLLGVLCFGADIAGVGRGTFSPERPSGTVEAAYLMVKQDGAKLTGRTGPSEKKNYEFIKGAIDGDTVTFELFADDMRMKVSIKLKDGNLKGW